MSRPYALIRAGFPYVKSLGAFRKVMFPVDVAFGSEGRIYVLCPSAGGPSHSSVHYTKGTKGNAGPITMLNFDDEDLSSFDLPEGGHVREFPVKPGQVMEPTQLVLDSDENVYVSDQATHRITVFNRDGELLGIWGEYGTEKGQLNRPAGMAFDADENLFVVDTMNHRVQKFTKDGVLVMGWGSHGDDDGQFDMPWGIHIDELGDVYVGDWRNDRVQKFTAEGEFIFKIGESGTENGQMRRPAGVAVDKHGDIYVCDWGNNRVLLFDQEGLFIQKFIGDATLSKSTLERMFTRTGRYHRIRQMGSIDDEKYFVQPRSVRVDEQGYMFVCDYECYRIQVYQKQAYPLTEEQVIPPLRAPTLNYN